MRGIERRIQAGRDPVVASVASLFVSRWDKAVAGEVPEQLSDRLGIAVGQRTYRAYRQLLASDRWQRLAAAGARVQRLLWASTSTKNPAAPDTLYVSALAAPNTIDTVPEKTLAAFADHGEATGAMAMDGGDCDAVLEQFAKAGIDSDALAARLQQEGAESFVKSWKQLMQRIQSKMADSGVQPSTERPA
jgi:transaldolase